MLNLVLWGYLLIFFIFVCMFVVFTYFICLFVGLLNWIICIVGYSYNSNVMSFLVFSKELPRDVYLRRLRHPINVFATPVFTNLYILWQINDWIELNWKTIWSEKSLSLPVRGHLGIILRYFPSSKYPAVWHGWAEQFLGASRDNQHNILL